jgi:hypothetical protein
MSLELLLERLEGRSGVSDLPPMPTSPPGPQPGPAPAAPSGSPTQSRTPTQRRGLSRLVRNPIVTGVVGLILGLAIGAVGASGNGSPSPSPSVVAQAPIQVPPSTASNPTIAPTSTSTSAPPSSPATTQPAVGTRYNPYPYGQAAPVGNKWKVAVTKVLFNADLVVHHANMFNDKPKPGTHYVMVTVKCTYLGNGSAEAYYSLNFGVVGKSGEIVNTYDNSVYPDDLANAAKAPSGIAAVGNVAFMVKTSEISSLVLYVEPNSYGNSRGVFLRLRK